MLAVDMSLLMKEWLLIATQAACRKENYTFGTPIKSYSLDQLARKFNISFGSMVHCLSALITAVVSILFMYIMGHTVLVG